MCVCVCVVGVMGVQSGWASVLVNVVPSVFAGGSISKLEILNLFNTATNRHHIGCLEQRLDAQYF